MENTIIHKSITVLSIIIILIFANMCMNNILNNKKVIINNETISIKTSIKRQEYARLIIPKININQELFAINNKNNNVNQNITILKESIPPNKQDSIMIIAAHSGEGPIAFFERLDELDTNDEIKLIFKNKEYLYMVKEKWEEKKNGYININKESKKQLVLTTCSPTKKNIQLIVNCTEKES